MLGTLPSSTEGVLFMYSSCCLDSGSLGFKLSSLPAPLRAAGPLAQEAPEVPTTGIVLIVIVLMIIV